MAIKKSKFLSLKLILKLIFFTNNQIKIKKGIKIPICFARKITGYLMWSNKIDCSEPVLANPYVIVIKSLL